MVFGEDEYGNRGRKSSETGETRNKTDRRGFFRLTGARVIELASTVPLIALLIDNFTDRKKYFELDHFEATVSEKTDIPFLHWGNDYGAALDALDNAYYSAYHKSRTETHVSFDSDGNLQTETEIEYYWDEEANAPDHDVVSSWAPYHRSVLGASSSLASTPVVDKDKLDQIRIVDKETSKVFDGILGCALYGGEIALLLGYEEIKATLDGARGLSMKERVENTNTPKQISRRSVFKVLAALAGAGAAYGVGALNEESRAEGKAELKNDLETALKGMDMSPVESFAAYYGRSYSDILGSVKNVVSTCETALRNGIHEDDVPSSMRRVASEGRRYLDQLNAYFSKGVPADLGQMAKMAIITQKLDAASSSQSAGAHVGLLLEGIAVAGAMAVVLVPAEVYNSKNPGADEKKGLKNSGRRDY